jgi:hypothetical protein
MENFQEMVSKDKIARLRFASAISPHYTIFVDFYIICLEHTVTRLGKFGEALASTLQIMKTCMFKSTNNKIT